VADLPLKVDDQLDVKCIEGLDKAKTLTLSLRAMTAAPPDSACRESEPAADSKAVEDTESTPKSGDSSKSETSEDESKKNAATATSKTESETPDADPRSRRGGPRG
jgi:predicted RNA-binding protein with RPS1 domain